MFDKLNNEKKPSNIMRQILDAIERGDLKESDKLPNEQELAKEFSVSRSVIREAMSSLVTMGVIKRIPGNGTFVQNKETAIAPISQGRAILWDHLEEIEKVEGSYDAYLARLMIEPMIVEYAARRIEQKDIKKLSAIFREMENAANERNLKKYQAKDLDFHMELARSSGNKVLYQIFEQIMELIGFNLWNAYRIWPADSKSIFRSLEDHRDLLQLIKSSNPVLARDKMGEHLTAAFWEFKDME